MPVFVVTHDTHNPIVKDGGTTYSFVTGGLDRALDQARAAAGDKDVAIGGGANIVRQRLAVGVIDRSGYTWSRCCWAAGFGCSTTDPSFRPVRGSRPRTPTCRLGAGRGTRTPNLLFTRQERTDHGVLACSPGSSDRVGCTGTGTGTVGLRLPTGHR